MRVLVVSDSLPYPLVSGDRIRSYNLIRRIARKHQVSLATFIESPDQVEGVPHMQKFCERVEIATMRRHHPVAHLPGLLRYALAGKPLEHKFYYSEELANKIRNLVSTMAFDIVQFQKEWMAQYWETIPADARCKSIFMADNFTPVQYNRIFHIERRPIIKLRALLYSWMEKGWERRYLERFDLCTTVSETDRRQYLKANPRLKIEVIPNGVDTQLFKPLPQENTSPVLLFIGNLGYAPCVDAALWFCREIFPRIRSLIREVEVWLVGSDPRPEILKLGGDGVHVTGRVDDIVPYYRWTSVCVVPLRAGGGTRLKILEAMALGRPVVSTTVGCEGLDVVDGEHLLVADSPEQFAEQTVHLLSNQALYQRLVSNSRQLVVARYDWDVIAEQLMHIYSEITESLHTETDRSAQI